MTRGWKGVVTANTGGCWNYLASLNGKLISPLELNLITATFQIKSGSRKQRRWKQRGQGVVWAFNSSECFEPLLRTRGKVEKSEQIEHGKNPISFHFDFPFFVSRPRKKNKDDNEVTEARDKITSEITGRYREITENVLYPSLFPLK